MIATVRLYILLIPAMMLLLLFCFFFLLLLFIQCQHSISFNVFGSDQMVVGGCPKDIKNHHTTMEPTSPKPNNFYQILFFCCFVVFFFHWTVIQKTNWHLFFSFTTFFGVYPCRNKYWTKCGTSKLIKSKKIPTKLNK